jgi:hypothetical protein
MTRLNTATSRLDLTLSAIAIVLLLAIEPWLECFVARMVTQ